MQKSLLFISVLLLAFTGHGQKKFAFSALANFDFATKNLVTNDAGFGFSLNGNFFARHKLQLRLEASLDHFIGSKLLLVDSAGNHYTGNPTMISFKAGPEFFIIKELSVAGLYGPVFYTWFDKKVKEDEVKFSLTAHIGKTNRFLLSVYFADVLKTYPVQYFGVSFGYRIL